MAGHSRWALVYSAPVLQTDRALPHSLKPFPKLISSWVSVAAELLTCYPFQKYLILKWYPSITVFQAKEEVSNGENSATGAGKETTWACVGLRSCVLCRHLWLVLGTAAAGGISSGAGRSPPRVVEMHFSSEHVKVQGEALRFRMRLWLQGCYLRC